MKILSYFKTGSKELTAYYDEGDPRIIDIIKIEEILAEWLEHNQWIIDHGLEENLNYQMKDTEILQNDLNYFEVQTIEQIPIPIIKDYLKIGMYGFISRIG